MSQQQAENNKELEGLIDLCAEIMDKSEFCLHVGLLPTADILSEARTAIIRLGGLKPYIEGKQDDR